MGEIARVIFTQMACSCTRTPQDTANVYSNGVSEEIIGKAIKKYNIPRNKLVILSKCYGYVGETPDVRGIMYGQDIAKSKDYVNRGGLSRNAIFEAVDASLARMDTKYMDLLQIHRFDPYTPIEETMEALHDLVKMGKVNYIGASSMWAYQFAMMQACAEKHGWTKFVSMQVSIQRALQTDIPGLLTLPRTNTTSCTGKRSAR